MLPKQKIQKTVTETVNYFQVSITCIDRADSTCVETETKYFCCASREKLQRHILNNVIYPEWLEYNEEEKNNLERVDEMDWKELDAFFKRVYSSQTQSVDDDYHDKYRKTVKRGRSLKIMEIPNTVIIAIDIETRGRNMVQHGIISIGVCVGSASEEKVVDKMRWDLQPVGDQFLEQRCMDEFWSQHPKVLETLTKHAQPAKEQMIRFRNFIDMWHRWATHVYIVSDNPAFDLGYINYYLSLYNLLPLDYKVNRGTGKEDYVPLHDSDSYARGFLRHNHTNQWADDRDLIKRLGLTHLNKDNHDHMPENDAEFIYRLHYQVMNAK